ncbi:YgiQ family radical SAM protein [Porphyromonas crevioricanis]|uniref:YgiQ family radical SAM protein n=1 Tax=Porphyromonas crevioricanis TaxID=393921 RepID=UPI0005A616D7|nr:YgiQ family radical SAM protein [Porphyromonas crevioricanis]
MSHSAKTRPIWLPTTRKEMDERGWDMADVILFSGDAYVDHPAFGAAVVGRFLESLGLRVAIVPQPNWRDDLRDFRKLGRPRLFFGVSPGAMDSMVNKYTAHKRLRSEDAYTPDGRIDLRPEYPSIVYTECIRRVYPDVPIVLGGIEPSLRRLSHYDYWQDRLRPSILADARADLLIYGMGELPLEYLVSELKAGHRLQDLTDIPQTVYIRPANEIQVLPGDIVLHTHEECVSSKRNQAQNFCHIETESNKYHAKRILQGVGRDIVVVNPPFPPMTEAQIDRSFDLPYTRLPHPRYRGKRIGAYEMIKHSVNAHRGCFGGCAFCTISAHQGKFVASRSEASIIREVEQIVQMEDFKGYLSDVGGPSANMYKMEGRNLDLCSRCKRPSCIHPKVCPNLHADHTALTRLLRRIDKIEGVKKSFIGSGVRYDLLLEPYKDPLLRKAALTYAEDLVKYHVSGRLKVAPEHTSDSVLRWMRKPSFALFEQFKKFFDKTNKAAGLKQQIIPYFISSHPGCTEADMAELAVITKRLGFRLEQVQDFTPTPMTLATEIYYTGIDPYTLEPVYTARTDKQKKAQSQFFFWYKPDQVTKLKQELRRIGRADLIAKLFG